MRFFICLVDALGHAPSAAIRRTYESLPRSRGLDCRWQLSDGISVLIGGDESEGQPIIASDGEYVAVGTVRLDNRADLEQWAGCRHCKLSDLALVLRMVALHDTRYIPQLLGDFAFVVWNGGKRTLVAACDVFRVKQLYYAQREGLLAFASRAEALALEDRYDVRYLAELVAMYSPSPDLSVYAGVQRMPAGTLAVLENGRLSLREYWSARDFEPQLALLKSEREAAEICRSLLAESVRLRLSGDGDPWAQLSGGIDSSAVASVAQWLVERGTITRGLAGTVTYVDRQDTAADEREYSDAVVTRWQLRNEVIVDPPMWYDDQSPPPHLDEPHLHLALYPRERRLCAIVRAAGGRMLLTGLGGDELFAGIMFFFADWLSRGRAWDAAREMARRAAIGRVSFWELAYRNALLPLLPRLVQRQLVRDQGQVPSWMRQDTVHRYGLSARAFVASTYAGRIGRKYHHAVVTNVGAIGRAPIESGVIGDALDLRHPFLFRPLVEFALSLPPELCSRPHARKWLLRESMREILPEIVRTRVGKGSPAELYAWSLATQRSLLEPLIRDPILADLGVVDARELRAAFDSAPHRPHRREEVHALLHSTLTIEAWLQIRSGRWPRGRHIRSA